MQKNSRVLSGQSSPEIIYTGTAYLTGLFIPSALIGTLTITGLVNVAGAPTSWVIPVGTVGVVFSQAFITSNAPTIQFSSASDVNKSVLTYEVIN